MGYKSKKRQSEKAAAMPVMEEAGREGARVEADILRRKHDKKVARLKAKIRLMCESNGSEAKSAGNEGSGSDEEGGGQKPGRERPAGLSYKLRAATTRATVRKFIGRKAEQLEAWLTHAVGDDDSWQYVYAEGGPAHSSEPLPAVTKERSSSSSSSMAMSTRMELTGRRRASWKEADLRLINLSSSEWDADMEKLVQMVLPYGNLMIKWPSVEDMLKGQGEELAAVGLNTTEDMISSTLHLKLIVWAMGMWVK
eukprot:jgi/Tetstr1/426972/TSEL_017185.t1